MCAVCSLHIISNLEIILNRQVQFICKYYTIFGEGLEHSGTGAGHVLESQNSMGMEEQLSFVGTV